MTAAKVRTSPELGRPARVGIAFRLLVLASTVPWRHEARLVEPVRARLLALKMEGWMIREASARNFLIWRSAVCRQGRSRVIVLPSRHIALNRDERSAIAIDMLAAAGAIASTSELDRALGGAIHREAHYRSGMARVHQALSYGWAISTGSPGSIP